LHALQDRIWQFRRDRSFAAFINIGRGLVRAIAPHEKNARTTVQRDYVYFQDFIPDNTFDIRVVVIGNQAFAFKRMIRSGDFRASGSGLLDHDPAGVPPDCIRTAFEIANKLHLQSVAFDFVCAAEAFLIIEISYAFALIGYKDCPGYWDSSLRWHTAKVTPQRFMIEHLLGQLKIDGRGE
jgi:glutathione synthase/RimK-type ligase-like ATP-grasp enzyme